LYAAEPKQTQYSFISTGPFSGFDRQHELTFGVSHRKSEGGWDNGGEPLSAIQEVGNFYEWDGAYPEPVWDTPVKGSYETITQSAAYTAARLQFTDTFKLIAGTRVSNWEVDAEAGAWTATPYTITHDNLITPYLGAIYDVSDVISAYISYSDIFKPQTNRDQSGDYLDPISGGTYETGIKGVFFDDQLNASAAVFLIQQDNLAVRDGNITGTSTPAYYGAKGTKSKGYEFELSGELTTDWQLGMSWTDFSAKDANNNDVAVEYPRRTLKLYTKYKLQGDWSGLSLGGGFNWQSQEPRRSENPVTGTQEKVGQPAYSLLTLVANYEFNDELSLQVNLNNALDKTYYESSWGTYTYGEPRSARVTMNYRF
jgi:outer membrane receptor for ferric coprogen and ferric-rhodotorulic acid